MIVVMQRNYGSLFASERASFSDDEARGLIDRGIAAPVIKPMEAVIESVPVPPATPPVDPPKADDKPADPAADAAGGKKAK